MHTKNVRLALLLGLLLLGCFAASADDAADKAKIKKLIEQLGSDSYAERQQATEALDKIGAPAIDALKEAAKSPDAEVRKRAGELLSKVEKFAESRKVLGPKMVHLVYKDTPVKEAVAEFRTKSGYDIVLHDPENKLKDTKVTLDTGKVTFWAALEKFCEAAGVSDEDPNANRGIGAPPMPGGVPIGPRPIGPGKREAKPMIEEDDGPVALGGKRSKRVYVKDIKVGGDTKGIPLPPGMVGMAGGTWVPVQQGQIILTPTKPTKAASDTSSSIRVRQANKKRYPMRPAETEIGLVLEISPEPSIQWQSTRAVNIEKAIDDQDQKLSMITLDAVAPGADGRGAILPAGAAMPGMMMATPYSASGNGLSHFTSVRLKKDAKESTKLKELTGTISGNVLSPVEDMIVIEKVMKAKDKEEKGSAGGSIKITNIETKEDGVVQITFDFEQPLAVIAAHTMNIKVANPPTNSAPAGPPQGPPPKGAGLPAPPAAGVAVVRPAMAINVAGFGADMATYSAFGLRLMDEKGNMLHARIVANYAKGGGFLAGAATRKLEFVATYTPSKDAPAEPTKLVYSGRRQMLITVPFTLKDVELK